MRKFGLIIFIFSVLITQAFLSCKKLERSMFVSTGAVTEIHTNSAQVSASIIDIGEGVLQHGHCYSKTADPALSGQKTSLGRADANINFTSQISGLEPGTKYYVTAYVSNGSESSYGEVKSFTTAALVVPVLSTSEISAITTSSAISGGNISSDGGSAVTARGICWNTTTGPTILNNKTSDGSGTGSFSSNITSLTPGTVYYVRAYATNSVGTGYGNELTFTSKAATAPVLGATNAASGVLSTKAVSGGNITSDGGLPVSARGVCWNTSGNPTIADSKSSDGTGLGSFNSNLTGLTPGTKYYVKAYGTNAAGTGYGTEMSFTTITLAAPVLTAPASATWTFDLSWTYAWPPNVSADDHYEVESSYSPASGYTLMITEGDGIRTTPFTQGIMPEAIDIGKTMYFRVRVKINGEYSPYSNYVGVSCPYINLTYYPSFDNLVMMASNISSYQSTVYNDWTNGVGNSYTIGTYSNDYFIAASALYFKIDNFISGKTIQKAVLKFYVQSLPDNPATTYAVNPLSASWNTTTLTFDNLPSYSTTPEVVKAPPTSTTDPWEVDITSIVQSWANGTLVNNGIVVRDKNSTWPAVSTSMVTDFYSNEATDASRKPVIYIEVR